MEFLDLRQLLRPLLKWWWLLALAAVLGAASSLVYTLRQPPEYAARTTILVGSNFDDPNPNSVQLSISQQLAQAYADLAQRAPIQDATADALGLESLPPYTVFLVPDTQIIEITVNDGSPEVAQAVANELVNQLIARGPESEQEQDREDFINQQLAKLEASITNTEQEIEAKQAELADLFSARELAAAQGQITALETKMSSLQSNYAALLAQTQRGQLNRITVLEPAPLPRRPIQQNIPLNIAVAVVVGITLAALGAYLMEFLDNSLHNSEDVQRALDLPVLGTVPEIRGEDKLVMMKAAPSVATEAYRGLRTNLQYVSFDRPIRTVLVTGAAAHEGKSLTAANLALALASAGKRVILVDSDLHRPTQHRLFKASNKPGLTNILLEPSLELDTVLQQTATENLRFLPSGPLPPNPAELLASDRMLDLLEKLKAHADMVVFDSPPVTAVVDATVLSTLADGVLLVVRVGRTQKDTAQRALKLLRDVNARVLGTVVDGMAESRQGYYYTSSYGYNFSANGTPTRRQPSTAKPNAPKPTALTAGAPAPSAATAAGGGDVLPAAAPPPPSGLPGKSIFSRSRPKNGGPD